VDSSREQLGTAHEKIAQLETQLARLKRGFDPEPIANPISEEQHRELARSRQSPWLPFAIVAAVASWTMFLLVVYSAYADSIHPTVGSIPGSAKSHGAPARRAGSTSP
jgi:hypothetical protein